MKITMEIYKKYDGLFNGSKIVKKFSVFRQTGR